MRGGANASPQTESRIFGKSAKPPNRNGKLASLRRPLTACLPPRDARGVSRRSGLPRSGKQRRQKCSPFVRCISRLACVITFVSGRDSGSLSLLTVAGGPGGNWAILGFTTRRLRGPFGDPLFLQDRSRDPEHARQLLIPQPNVARRKFIFCWRCYRATA